MKIPNHHYGALFQDKVFAVNNDLGLLKKEVDQSGYNKVIIVHRVGAQIKPIITYYEEIGFVHHG